MARIRTIKPEFWTAEQVMECSPNARLLFIGMWNFCDDAGIHPASCKTLKAEVFPSDDITASEIGTLVAELEGQGLIEEYEVDGRVFWLVTGWHHQKIDQPTYKHPRPDGTIPEGAPKRRAARASSAQNAVFAECSPNNHRTNEECSPPEGRGREGKGREPPTPPTAREGEFPMDLSWEPSDHFPTLARQAGAPAPTAEALAEFRSYWIGQGAAMTQHAWDHKLLTNLKSQKLRSAQAPPGRPKARASPGQPRTLSEGRAAAAKAIFNPGPAEADDGHERRTIDVTPPPPAGLGAKALR